MRHLIISLCFCRSSPSCFAGGELTVFDVRKPIALSDKEIIQKDYYINAGSEAGLQKGMIITVIRKVPLYDTYQSRSAGDLTVPVAKVRIIQVQQGNSVARFASEIAEMKYRFSKKISSWSATNSICRLPRTRKKRPRRMKRIRRKGDGRTRKSPKNGRRRPVVHRTASTATAQVTSKKMDEPRQRAERSGPGPDANRRPDNPLNRKGMPLT